MTDSLGRHRAAILSVLIGLMALLICAFVALERPEVFLLDPRSLTVWWIMVGVGVVALLMALVLFAISHRR